MQKKDHSRIVENFGLRQSRQLLAIAIALFLILFLAVIHHRPDLFGDLPKKTIFAMQAIVIATFIGFSYINWRCPSCMKYLGPNVHKRGCGKCGARFQ